MTEAKINPEILCWARERMGYTLNWVAEKTSTKPETLNKWEQGEKLPSFSQAQKLAKQLHIPFGLLYLEQLPQHLAQTVDPAVPDLRTIENKAQNAYSPDLQEILADVLRKQEWLHEYRQSAGLEALSFVGKYQAKNITPEALAAEISSELHLSDKPIKKSNNTFIAELTKRVEALGVCVLRSGTVNGNTRRGLSVEEFRGFALSDAWAPMIFLNSKDSTRALPFTLVHELTHLWLGKSGVSDSGLGDPRLAEERFCNQVAAAVLVDAKDLRARLGGSTEEAHILTRLPDLCAHFGVSVAVLAIRAKDLGLLSAGTCWNFVHQNLREKKSSTNKGGGNYYNNRVAAISLSFSAEVLYSVESNRTLLRDAARLLGVSYSNIGTLQKKILARGLDY